MTKIMGMATFAEKACAILALALISLTISACGGGGGGGQPPTTSPATPPTTPAKVAQATLIANPSGFALTVGSSQSVAVSGGSGNGALSVVATPSANCTATLTDQTVNVVGVATGVCTIAIGKEGDDAYLVTETSVSVTVTTPAKAAQSAFVATPTTVSITVGNSKAVAVSGGSGNGALSVMATPSANCTATITGQTVNVAGVATGVCTVTVSKDGDGTYNPISTTVLATVVAVVNNDTTAPTAPTVSLQNDTTNGLQSSFATDGITNDPTVKVVGEAGASLRLTYTDAYSNMVVKTTTMPASGSTTVSLTAGEMGNDGRNNHPLLPGYNPNQPTGTIYTNGTIHDGIITVSATLTDVAGNVGGAKVFSFELDTVNSSPMDLSLGNPKQVQGLEAGAVWRWQRFDGEVGDISRFNPANWQIGSGNQLDTTGFGTSYWISIQQADPAGNWNGVGHHHFETY